ncbi:hypothetical protein [Streptomyces sp. NPDC053367]|uniref:hypothetical protein n=1 Tax=Streptomyces sp. NPDC053367 TaxID=3365700 RepID=UPI0037D33C27
MSVCATCYEPTIRDYDSHNCPGIGEITITRKRGHGLIVLEAPRRARIAVGLLADAKWGATMAGKDLINIAEQVLYQITGYDPDHAALVVQLVEDWRQPGILTFDHRLTDAEVEEIKVRWQERYGNPGACNHEPLTEEAPGA